MRLTPYLFAALCLFLLGSCASSKQAGWLSDHQVKLQKAANGDIAGAERLDLMASSLIDMMHQGLNFGNPKKGVRYLEAYKTQNAGLIKGVTSKLQGWYSGMSVIEKGSFILGLTQKAYVKDLIDLIPRFKNKYKQFKIANDIVGLFGPSLMDLGMKQLGGILKN